CYRLAVFGVDRQLHLKRRTFAERRLHPNAAAMHFDNLLGDGEAKPRTAFRLGVRAVDLVELLEDARLVLLRDAGPGVGHTQGEMAIAGSGGDAYLAGVGELDGIAHQVEQHLSETLLVAHAHW